LVCCALVDNRVVAPDDLLASLRAAVEAAPDDMALRLHLADLLAAAGRREEAVREAAQVLVRDPQNEAALRLVAGGAQAVAPASGDEAPSQAEPVDEETPDDLLRRLDAEFADVVPPMFADGAAEPGDGAYDIEQVGVRLADVGGMEDVKARLEAAFLAPIRNPQLGKLYGKSLRGGLLLYGPPGCGKTFIARALAGELQASFLPVSLADVLDMYIGQSERNMHDMFEVARRNRPCVIFLDEVDAIGQKRSQMRNSAARGAVNQLLSEMDGVTDNNEGVFVLGATNHPWDVDTALRRPGRFDRTVLVLPPDAPARDAILRYHLRDRPIENVDTRKLTQLTDGYSGADLAHVCDTAAERALLDSASSGTVRMIQMGDLEAALAEVRPSIGPWLQTARNVAQYANQDGSWDDLLAYLRKRKLV
jgi:SpoVK/Ycf46/Vps4 family AAA+-type ATPase